MRSRGYVSNELVHWTGREKSDAEAFAILRAICSEEILRLSYCPNHVNAGYRKESAMVCFTDIPLRHSREHCSKFGRFGIGFSKSRMIEYGANPVHYTTRAHFEKIVHVARMLERMKDSEKDREWKEDGEPYSFTENETVALLEVGEFLQEYAYKNEDHSSYVTYYQREWRLTFNSLPFAGGTSEHRPGMSCFYIRDGKSYRVFKFSPDDIEFLIVPWRYYLKSRQLAKRYGYKVKCYELHVGT
ncbi:abortive infection system antitoxin AbiGi family protein [Nitrospira lenta]|uniref:Uncharacterized protein n=1 Tax=Nitrospira lenta TaxID=1436998 RepID=A0A330L7Q9_9BACT|nr:abortive infection system antitoxin AbiGi family protein [Nitrospira lenta]SPP65998.1 conserved hypothetical protein [Nitrospira lenta]